MQDENAARNQQDGRANGELLAEIDRLKGRADALEAENATLRNTSGLYTKLLHETAHLRRELRTLNRAVSRWKRRHKRAAAQLRIAAEWADVVQQCYDEWKGGEKPALPTLASRLEAAREPKG